MTNCQAHLFVILVCFLYLQTGTSTNDIDINGIEELPNLAVNVTNSVLVAIDGNATINCNVKPPASHIWWNSDDQNITSDGERFNVENAALDEAENMFSFSTLNIFGVELLDTGNYTCNAASSLTHQMGSATSYLNVTILGTVVTKQANVRVKIHDHATLYCIFRGLPLTDFHWVKYNDSSSINDLKHLSNLTQINDTYTNLTLTVSEINRQNNGSYHCMARDAKGFVSDVVAILVLDRPQVRVDFITAVGAHKIYLNWTINDGNDPIKQYAVQYMKKGMESWLYSTEPIGVGNMSFVLKNLDKNSEYQVMLSAENNEGAGQFKTQFVKTLDADPDFVPHIEVKGVTFDSMTIGWTIPPVELRDHVHYYEILAQAYNSTANNEAVASAQSMSVYLFQNLKAATTYNFKVRACSEYTKLCGKYSQVVNGTTMDGLSGQPQKVTIQCRFDNISQTSFVFVGWEPPKTPNGKIVSYHVVLEGGAHFRNARGVMDSNTFGPKVKSVDEKSRSARFDMIPANTNYTVHVSGTTRKKRRGERVSVNCTMPPTIPDKESLFKFRWTKLEEHGNYIFKLTIPKISERSGAICCYRVFIVRLKQRQSTAELPSPEDMVVSSYKEVHKPDNGGAYVAEMFASDALLSAVFLGDNYTLNTTNSACLHCTGIRPAVQNQTVNITNLTSHEYSSATTLLPLTTTTKGDAVTTIIPTPIAKRQVLNRIRRDINLDILKLTEANAEKADPTIAYDGQLDVHSNYTAFVEIIVYGGKGESLAAYSSYMEVQQPAPDAIHEAFDDDDLQPISLITQILCGILLIAIVFVPAICLLHKYTKQVARAQGAEMITLRNSFRQLCRSLRGRHQLVSSHPPNMAPISKSDLLEAYVERHRDSDYGFQQEFEQLPDRFPDRTTRASDARENIYKNRYPDIKAYDQTRVRLTQIDSIAGSDYINANVVLGYKERKKFICAQGPMDKTVCDYWRMIWEQRLELVMMLTNLEEYSKSKCAKYWPDKIEGSKCFGDLTVSHVNELRFSDYIIRELKVSRGQEERAVTQYHFLVWKDFMAPEHPHGILKFIKRMNEAHSLERGPVLVHCSAGVGRTGTLVALDSLLQQLQEEQQVTIFNTICDLRHQRNFLVQSLKQYVFVYRALMEMAQFGDTEMPVNKIKTLVKDLKKCEKDKSGMADEYEKLKSVLEDRKAFSVGTAEENRAKNRCELVIPYDRNRVILTPIPGHEHSTYINASFIEGYDNCESFIITQDPLESTIADFWRMIFEQGVNVVVMLSDLGNDNTKKCPRYWPDDEVSYDHIRVKYIHSESCPYYTKRELSVTNRKVDEMLMVTQLQYHGWPTVEGEVPEVTRGLIELADQVQALQGNGIFGTNASPPAIVVHCTSGSDRSSMFVGLCILIQQLRVEKRIDVFTTTRKLRSQRSYMLNTFAQYEFLYRAIVNYADLHHFCEDSSET